MFRVYSFLSRGGQPELIFAMLWTTLRKISKNNNFLDEFLAKAVEKHPVLKNYEKSGQSYPRYHLQFPAHT
jgi:hypothetical protein